MADSKGCAHVRHVANDLLSAPDPQGPYACPSDSTRLRRARNRVLQYLKDESDQRIRLTSYFDIRLMLNEFFQVCRRVRMCVQSNHDATPVDDFRLASALEGLRDALLQIVTDDRRERIDNQASQFAKQDVRRLKNLRGATGIAHAELLLRKLVVLCLRNASLEWTAKHRLPDWKHRIAATKDELEAAVENWDALNDELDPW